MNLASNQAYIFLVFILTGIIIGLIFDVFRAVRKSFKINDFFTYIQDIIFWLLVGSIIMYVIFKFNYGEIRAYMLFGTLLRKHSIFVSI